MNNKKKWFIFVICLTLSIVGTILVFSENVTALNDYFYKNFVNRTDFLTSYFKVITAISDIEVMMVLCGLSLITLLTKKRYSLYLIFIMMFSTAVNQTLKYLLIIPRPLDYLIKESGYSFPSGHTMAAVSFFGFFIWLVLNSKLNKKYKWIINSLLTFLIINIAYSRIYLGVHYFTDIICGVLISICILIAGTSLIKRYGKEVF